MRLLKYLIITIVCQILMFSPVWAQIAEPDKEVDINFQRLQLQKKDNEVPDRTFKNFIPYKITLKNLTDQEYIVNFDQTEIILDNNKSIQPTGQKLVYKKSKQHPIIRSIVIGIPVTLISGGLLTIPFVATTYALGVDANNTLKKDLRNLYFENKIIKPNEESTFYVFLPNSSHEIQKIILK